MEVIDKEIYDKLPYNRRNRINSHIQQIHQHAGNPSQFISVFHGLDDNVQLARLWERNAEDIDTRSQMKNLIELNRKMDDLKQDLNKVSTIKEQVEDIYKHSKDISDQHTKLFEKEQETNDQMESFYEKTKLLQKRISENEQEIEDKKRKVLAFYSNIDESQEQLNKILHDLTNKINDEIQSKTGQAEKLITEAETALELRSTEGISRAYGERLKKLNEDNSKGWWIAGAVFFLILSLLLGLMLTGFSIGEWSFPNTENPAVIFGRIAMTGIGITAAVFCAKRYLYIKNLEEDYEYKVVLTKSILAFAKIGRNR